MSYAWTWLFCIVATAAVSVWAVGVLLRTRPRYRDAVQAIIILAAFLLMILGFIYGVNVDTKG
jgi:hypothetical protein